MGRKSRLKKERREKQIIASEIGVNACDILELGPAGKLIANGQPAPSISLDQLEKFVNKMEGNHANS